MPIMRKINLNNVHFWTYLTADNQRVLLLSFTGKMCFFLAQNVLLKQQQVKSHFFQWYVLVS